MEWLIVAPLAGLSSLACALYLYYYLIKQETGSPKMRDIADAIRIGANAYLKRQNITLAVFVIVMAVLLAIFLGSHIALAMFSGRSAPRWQVILVCLQQ